MAPPLIRPPGGSTPRTVRASVVLPHPLSPTSPTTSPGAMARLMRSSTCATPWSVANSTDRSLTERRSAIGRPGGPGGAARAADARVEHVAQAVAQEVEAHDGQEDGDAGRGGVPPRVGQELARLGDGAAPLRRGRRGTEAEKAEGGGGQDREAHADRGAHDDGRRHVG